MLIKLFTQDRVERPAPKEGDLYKKVEILGRTFVLRYGYYEEFERYGRYNEPMPIYPNFVQNPVYTADGTPFTTEMQDVCSHYKGEEGEDSCAACGYFRRIEDLFGICTCPQNRQQTKKEEMKPQGGNEV